MQEPIFRDPTMPPEMQTQIGDGWNMTSGLDGIPFRTREQGVPTYKEDDPEHLKPQAAHEVSVKIFDLGDAEALEEYEKVLNMCAQALGRVMGQDVQYNKQRCTWMVLLTWATYFYEDPRETRREQKKYYM